MRKFNKIFKLMIALAVCVSLTACSETNTDKSVDEETNSTVESALTESADEVNLDSDDNEETNSTADSALTENTAEMNLESIAYDYFQGMVFFLQEDFNRDNDGFFSSEKLNFVKATLEFLYNNETGKEINDEEGYVLVGDYIAVANKYFDLDTTNLETIFRQANNYVETEDKISMSDGLGSIVLTEPVSFTFEEGILTVEYRYGYKDFEINAYSFVLNTLVIEINDDGSYKYISNTVGTQEYFADENGNVSEKTE